MGAGCRGGGGDGKMGMKSYIDGSTRWIKRESEAVTEQIDCLNNIPVCPDPGSNRGPSDLQSDALPTELSGLMTKFTQVIYPNTSGNCLCPGAWTKGQITSKPHR